MKARSARADETAQRVRAHAYWAWPPELFPRTWVTEGNNSSSCTLPFIWNTLIHIKKLIVWFIVSSLNLTCVAISQYLSTHQATCTLVNTTGRNPFLSQGLTSRIPSTTLEATTGGWTDYKGPGNPISVGMASPTLQDSHTWLKASQLCLTTSNYTVPT